MKAIGKGGTDYRMRKKYHANSPAAVKIGNIHKDENLLL
jgi:hypothetical protein